MLKTLASVLFAPLLLLFAVGFAAAQEPPPDTVVNVGGLLAPWLELLLATATLIIPALAAWAAAELRRRTGIAIELAHMQTFQQALTNGAGLLIAKAGDVTKDVSWDTRNPLIKEAILYVNRSAPDAVAYFGVTPEAIAEKLIAKLGLATAPVAEKVITQAVRPQDSR